MIKNILTILILLLPSNGRANTKFLFDYAFGVDQFCLSSAQAYLNSLPSTGPANKELFTNWISKSNDWADEALQWTPAFQAAWDGYGPILLKEAERIIEQKLDRDELSISLFLCLNRNSMGSPLSINIPYYLPTPAKSYKQNLWWAEQLKQENVDLPLPLYAFVEMTFHELLHLLVLQLFTDRQSELLKSKYAGESQIVKSHLHVFAIEKAVYAKLAKKYPRNEYLNNDVLKLSKRFFKVTEAKGYIRAWEIVDGDGAQPFINELVDSSTKQKICPWCKDGNWLSIEWLLKLIDTNKN